MGGTRPKLFTGAGMVVGALGGSRLIPAPRYGHAVLVGTLISVGAAFVMAASMLWPQPLLAGLSFFLFGAGPII